MVPWSIAALALTGFVITGPACFCSEGLVKIVEGGFVRIMFSLSAFLLSTVTSSVSIVSVSLSWLVENISFSFRFFSPFFSSSRS